MLQVVQQTGFREFGSELCTVGVVVVVVSRWCSLPLSVVCRLILHFHSDCGQLCELCTPEPTSELCDVCGVTRICEQNVNIELFKPVHND